MSRLSPNPAAAPLRSAAPPVMVEEEKRRKRHKLERSEPVLNLVAMLDMAFQILIFFILTANFAVGEGVLTANLPQTGGSSGKAITPAQAEPPKQKMFIVISSAGVDQCRVRVENSPRDTANFDELTQLLTSMQYDPVRNPNGIYKADNPIIIKPDGAVRWQHVVNAFNAAIKARYSNVSFAALSSGGS